MKTNTLASLIVAAATTVLISSLFVQSFDEEKEDLSHQEKFQEDYRIYSLNLPEDISFADEKAPMTLVDVREHLDRELLVNTYWQSNTLLYIKRSHKWFPIIEPILKEEGVPDDFKYLAVIESGLQQIVSPSGAAGYWQIMSSTAKELGLEVNNNVDERYYVEKATRAACAYLKEAYGKYNSWTLAAASYNMGMNGMDRRLESQQVDSYYDLLLNDETARYVYRILAVKTILSNPDQFGFMVRENDLYANIQTVEITVDTAISDLVAFAQQHEINYKVLKQLNPWLRQGELINNSGKKYTIKLPDPRVREKVVQTKQ